MLPNIAIAFSTKDSPATLPNCSPSVDFPPLAFYASLNDGARERTFPCQARTHHRTQRLNAPCLLAGFKFATKSGSQTREGAYQRQRPP